tara:strand:- start:40 stop:309 length:270 start_codon:yes stop_codon:yes gene_type:complete
MLVILIDFTVSQVHHSWASGAICTRTLPVELPPSVVDCVGAEGHTGCDINKEQMRVRVTVLSKVVQQVCSNVPKGCKETDTVLVQRVAG